VSVEAFAFDYEGDVGELLVVKEHSEIFDKGISDYRVSKHN